MSQERGRPSLSTVRPRGGLGLLCVLLMLVVTSCSSGRGYMERIREESVVQEQFDFMVETSLKETPGNTGGKPAPDEIKRGFRLGFIPRDDALARVIEFAQAEGWKPDAGSAATPKAQLKQLEDGRSLRLLVLAAGGDLVMTVEGPV